MPTHRIATQDLSTEAFLSSLIDYLALRNNCGAVDQKPLRTNADAMEERKLLLHVIRMFAGESLPTLTSSGSSLPISI